MLHAPQKRTLLLGEHLSEDLLRCLPNRLFVWTIPKVLRVFLRPDRQLFADIGRHLYDILARYFTLAAGVMACPKCGSRMELIAVILDPAEICKIIAFLAKHGRGSPTVG